MAPKTTAKCGKASAKDPNPKRTIKPKLYINTRENDSKITKRCCLCGASVRSEDTETALQDTADAAVNVSAEPLDSIQPAEPRLSAGVPSPAVLPKWNGRRRRTPRRTPCSKRYFYQYTYKLRSGVLRKDVELEVTSFSV